MKQGDIVYFITKGVVRRGILINQNDGKAVIRYQRGNYQKLYHQKLCQIANAIEGGADERLSHRSDTASNKGCNNANNKVSELLESDKEGQKAGNKLFVGAWRICNMA